MILFNYPMTRKCSALKQLISKTHLPAHLLPKVGDMRSMVRPMPGIDQQQLPEGDVALLLRMKYGSLPLF
ncbi:MAG: hypothetical protein RIT36_505, partial [Bacteroidota bacterium]